MKDLKEQLEELKTKQGMNDCCFEKATRQHQATNVSIGEEIAILEKQIAESEVTYSIGDRFELFGCKRILASAGGKCYMIGLDDGTQQANSCSVGNNKRITQAEFDAIRSNCRYTRYWDARKQEKC